MSRIHFLPGNSILSFKRNFYPLLLKGTSTDIFLYETQTPEEHMQKTLHADGSGDEADFMNGSCPAKGLIGDWSRVCRLPL